MKFSLFDLEHKFRPSVLIYVVDIGDDNGWFDHYYFWTRKSAEKFFEKNMKEMCPEYHIGWGGEALWI